MVERRCVSGNERKCYQNEMSEKKNSTGPVHYGTTAAEL